MGRATHSGNQTTLYLTPMHADTGLIRTMLANVQAAIRHIIQRAVAGGKSAGTLAPVEADARRYMEWGATFVAVGSDLGLFRSATQALRDKFAS